MGAESVSVQEEGAVELDITEGQLLEALQRAVTPDNPEGAMTIEDLRGQLGWSYGRIRRELHRLKDEGKLDVLRVSRPDLTGRMLPRPAYRFVNGQGI